MANEFTRAEWGRIRSELDADPQKYGLPRRVYGTVVIASFNIRKLGKLKVGRSTSGRDEATMKFLADICRQFDLVAIQEVMTEMAAVRRLRELMGPEYGLIVSDVVGTFPGESGNEERLAYIYNRNLVERTELVSEVTTSRTKVIKTVARHHRELFDLMESRATAKSLRRYYDVDLPAWREAVAAGSRRKAPKMPKFDVAPDRFVQFIRTPFAASFSVHGHPGLESYPFLAVNAHLHFGRPIDRRLEAEVLVEWILGKLRSKEASNIVLLGDLNFSFERPKRDLERIVAKFEELGGFSKGAGKQVYVSFPFIFPHPRPRQEPTSDPDGLLRSNVRLTQTYDQIGVFSLDRRVGGRLATSPEGHSPDEQWGLADDAPDYGCFDFATLFSRALAKGRNLEQLAAAEGKGARSALIRRFEHRVSDHMPIWIRIPLPRPTDRGGFPLEV
jgi:hypothetical protein